MVQEQETDCPVRFQGQWFDDESGLHYNFNRYYDPACGSYISQDPIGLDGGTRSYGYVHNPLSWVDPFGLACENVNATNRTEAFNAAKDRAGVPRSQQPIEQGSFRPRYPDSVKDGVGTNLNEGNPASQGRWYKYETPQGDRYIVEHDVDPYQDPHFHAVENKPLNPPVEQGGNYKPVEGKHHIFYPSGS